VSSRPANVTNVYVDGFTCYFLDPDDITLEIIQPPPRRS
jgi:hypothetical protein